MTPNFCIHDLSRCGKPAVMQIDMGPEFHSILYYCREHIPVGFNGIIPDENKIGGCENGIEVS